MKFHWQQIWDPDTQIASAIAASVAIVSTSSL